MQHKVIQTSNTTIASLMSFINIVRKDKFITKEELRSFLILLNPLAPHITSEIYEIVFGGNIIDDKWPEFDESKAQDNEITIAIQVNGKLRGTILAPKDLDKDELLKLAKEEENVSKHLEGKEIIKEIVIPNKIVNLVIK